MSRRNNGDYEYGQYSRYKKESLGDRIRNSIDSTLSGIADLFPKKDNYRGSGYNYSSYDYDYTGSKIRNKNTLSPVVIFGRIVAAGSVLAGVGAAIYYRQNIFDAAASIPQRVSSMFPNKEVGGSAPLETAAPVSPTLTPESTDGATKLGSEVARSENQFGVYISYDANGTPLSYELNGEVTQIDKQAFLDLKEKAIENKLPELVFYINLPNQRQMNEFEFTPDRPKTTELPSDALSEEDLSKRGITIIQGKDVKLHLREGAFLPGQSLDTFQPGTENAMKIVLVDGPTVSAAYMEDAKYNEVRGLLEKSDADIEKYRQSEIAKWQMVENESKTELQNLVAQGDESMAEIFQDEMINAQISISEMEKASAASLAVQAGMTEAAGLYVPRFRTVFVAVGKTDGDGSSANLSMYIDTKGNIVVKQTTTYGGEVDNVPKESKTYPRPSDFAYNPENGEPTPTNFPGRFDPEKTSATGFNYEGFSPINPQHYPYAGQETSQIFRHELQHDTNMTAYPSYNMLLDDSEWFADMGAMGGINEAWNKFKDSGFKDNTGYWIIFEKDGEYILGGNINNAPQGI